MKSLKIYLTAVVSIFYLQLQSQIINEGFESLEPNCSVLCIDDQEIIYNGCILNWYSFSQIPLFSNNSCNYEGGCQDPMGGIHTTSIQTLFGQNCIVIGVNKILGDPALPNLGEGIFTDVDLVSEQHYNLEFEALKVDLCYQNYVHVYASNELFNNNWIDQVQTGYVEYLGMVPISEGDWQNYQLTFSIQYLENYSQLLLIATCIEDDNFFGEPQFCEAAVAIDNIKLYCDSECLQVAFQQIPCDDGNYDPVTCDPKYCFSLYEITECQNIDFENFTYDVYVRELGGGTYTEVFTVTGQEFEVVVPQTISDFDLTIVYDDVSPLCPGYNEVFENNPGVTCDQGPAPSFSNNCNLFNFYSNNSSPEALYYWDFGDGNTSSQANPQHLYDQTGPFTVTLTVSTSCGIWYECTIDVQVDCIINFTCTCPGPGETIYIYDVDEDGETLLSDLLAAGVSLTNECVIVMDRLVIDQTYFLDNANFYMEPGSEITVDGGIFRVTNSSFEGCTQMWKGINVAASTPSSSNMLLLINSTVKDAEFAVTLNENAVDVIQGTTFENNYVGIYVPPTPELKTINHFAFRGNTFTSSGLLLDKYPGQQNYPDFNLPNVPDRVPYAGIWVNDLAVFDVKGYQTNHFTNIRNGIIADNCSMEINNVNMSNLLGAEFKLPYLLTEYTSGHGIYLNQMIDVEITDATIDQCLNGITILRSHYAQLNIYENDISNCFYFDSFWPHGHGMFIQYGRSPSITIEDNNITDASRGIRLFLIDLPTSLVIQENTFNQNLETHGNIGIGFAAHCTEEAPGFIQNNTFDFGENIKLASGIVITQSDYVGVEDNIINYNDISNVNVNHINPGYGIYASAVENCQFRNNEVNQAVDHEVQFYGIRAENALGNVYCCNLVNGMENGIGFRGECSMTEFRGTDIGDTEFGLSLIEGEIGIQIHAGNLWTGANSNGTISGQNPDLIALNSRFLFNPSQIIPGGTLKPDDIQPPSIANGEWFEEQSGLAATCLTQPDCGIEELGFDEEPPTDDKEKELIKVAKGKTLANNYKDNYLWMAQLHLFELLDNNPDLKLLDPAIDSFYTASVGTILEDYYTVIKQIKNAWLLSSVDSLLLNQKYDLILQDLSDIRFVDSQLEFDEENQSLIQQKDSLLLILLTHTNSFNSQKVLIKKAVQKQYSSVSAAISTLQTTYQHHTVMKDYLEVLALEVFLGAQALGTREWVTLITIAKTCQLEYGNPVFGARALVSNHPDYYVAFDLDSCQTVKPRGVDLDKTRAEIEWELTPNPSSGDFQLTLNLIRESEVVIEILDINGKLIYRVARNSVLTLNENLNIVNQVDGVYLIKLTINKQQTLTKMLVLQK